MRRSCYCPLDNVPHVSCHFLKPSAPCWQSPVHWMTSCNTRSPYKSVCDSFGQNACPRLPAQSSGSAAQIQTVRWFRLPSVPTRNFRVKSADVDSIVTIDNVWRLHQQHLALGRSNEDCIVAVERLTHLRADSNSCRRCKMHWTVFGLENACYRWPSHDRPRADYVDSSSASDRVPTVLVDSFLTCDFLFVIAYSSCRWIDSTCRWSSSSVSITSAKVSSRG